ncbi:DeoR/GlpR family DNA-binding transcription regulator [Ligilactobacillus murinus]|jgi:Transcriptional regulators of sugar metabolism|uniref:Lactose phosphotransferase system repressor n=1 Tax=Ligilactobacillus murinus DSM 20452 = NBRC 14221 TaxID=1423772 RepID=A0A0R2B1K0_9LACO|nr:DeoR/GlpR family DNA-binding transcription regulator [Ligilactobacillus murinus]GFI62665.1 lactose phosphotransferase system repressor [Lactobacillaceae bacterium]KRM71844.1 deoR-like helix-turn-helix domain protein [Ligilactobacillus murinus DSM 20452 = NBRC 14221]MCZ0673386.1 DeoR/GlpR family DNA-binding transcription regulator [Ligilactobacillus murinus]MCZ0694312.1 DeoR/GlpR family DNA-binding transcription regulator [Ligilactobacillus murinus]MCZ0700528.1 DeoR/GlpR family DNA-binding t
MKKRERLEEITRLVNQKGTIRVSDIVKLLNVTDMTVRRDLVELEEQGVLTKIHGGARSNKAFQYREYSHAEKHIQNKEAKQAIASKAAQLIEDGDTIFLGPGTTVAFLAEALNNQRLTVITNCMPVFTLLMAKKTEDFQVFLLGGEYRQVTEAFVGEITNTSLEKLRFSKMFFSGNGVRDGEVMTSTLAEAYTQNLALKHSLEKYLLLDSSKIGKDDFTSFCKLRDLTALITDVKTEDENYRSLEPEIEIIN